MNFDVPIEISNLSKTYRLGFLQNRQVRALQGLNLKIERGQVYGLLGPNGAGKSTTIKVLMNLVQASTGAVRLFGLPPQSETARREVGFLPENPAPYEYLTGREFVELSGRLGGLSGATLKSRVNEVLASVDMERAGSLQIRRYSKGMNQRIGLAQAIVARPRLLILDEPTSGLDPVGRRQIRDLILTERQRGTTILFCTHIISDVEALCDRVVVLVGGKRVREGSVRELLTSQASVVELTVEGVSEAQVRGLGEQVSQVQAVGERLLLRAPDASIQNLIRGVQAAGGRISQLQPSHFSLEELFLEALKEARQGGTVGGEIQ